MKNFILTVLLATSLLLVHQQTADAQERGFGVGAVIGTPDGLSYKAWVSEDAAVAGAVSFTISNNASSFYTHADFLMHKFYEELNWEVGTLHYTYGGGVSMFWSDSTNDSIYGVRLPSGMGFIFTDVPVDMFFEIAPTIDVSPDFRFGFDGSLGFRFYLN
ncbi:MAG: hypothetical protein WD035_03815 [Balneolaceae bacterium]